MMTCFIQKNKGIILKLNIYTPKCRPKKFTKRKNSVNENGRTQWIRPFLFSFFFISPGVFIHGPPTINAALTVIFKMKLVVLGDHDQFHLCQKLKTKMALLYYVYILISNFTFSITSIGVLSRNDRPNQQRR